MSGKPQKIVRREYDLRFTTKGRVLKHQLEEVDKQLEREKATVARSLKDLKTTQSLLLAEKVANPKCHNVVYTKRPEVPVEIADLLVRDYAPLPHFSDMLEKKKEAKDIGIPDILLQYFSLDHEVRPTDEYLATFSPNHLPQFLRGGHHLILAKHVTMLHIEIVQYMKDIKQKFSDDEIQEISGLLPLHTCAGAEIYEKIKQFFGSDLIIKHPVMHKKEIALTLLLDQIAAKKCGTDFDLYETINKSYLHISHHNVETLTELCLKRGKIPQHMDFHMPPLIVGNSGSSKKLRSSDRLVDHDKVSPTLTGKKTTEPAPTTTIKKTKYM